MMLLGYVCDAATVTQRDAEMLTHIHIAFGRLESDGRIDISHLNMPEHLARIRGYNPNLKISVSLVPKEGHPDAFTKGAASADMRKKVAQSCAELVTEHGFDGVDFDWEYPCVPSNGMDSGPEDRHNFTLLCEETRRAIDEARTGALLSIAAGADLYYVESVELPQLAGILDYVCLMTYDLKCGFHALAGHHTALYSSTGDVFRNSCDQALRLFHEAGMPKEKLAMGAAFYSRKWENVKDRNHGLLQISPRGGGYGPGFGDLSENWIDRQGFTRYWDDEAKAPYLFDGSTFLSYDDETSLAHKAAYVRENGYAGIFYWQHGSDPTRRLLTALYDGLTE